jgi:hypothetical protein
LAQGDATIADAQQRYNDNGELAPENAHNRQRSFGYDGGN